MLYGPKKDCLVELSGIWIVDRPAILCFLLSANLFPGGKGRVSNNEWCLPSTEYIESHVRRCELRNIT